MTTTRRFSFAAFLAVAVAGCNPNPPGRCTVQQDCRGGSACTDGICLPEGAPGTCAPSCPNDFSCQAQVCVAAFAPEVSVLSPTEGTFAGPTVLPVRVAAKAPGGVAAVWVRLVRGEAVLAEARAEPFADAWAASLDVGPDEVTEGAAQVVAVVRYGPPAAEGAPAGSMEAASAPVGVVVDRTPPEIVAAEDRAWHRAPFALAADVSDALSGADPETASLAAGLVEVNGTQGERGAGYTFAIDPAAAAPGAEGETAFEIRARDRVGNERRQQGTLRFDLNGPSIAPVPAAGWHLRSAAASLAADIADHGSGVASAWIASAAGAGVAPGSDEGAGRFRFTIAPADYTGDAFEGPLDLTVAAEDALGNRSTGTTTLWVDGRPPAVQIAPDAAWYARSATATVRVTGTDAGSGFVSASFGVPDRPVILRGANGGAVDFSVPLGEYVPADYEGAFPFAVTAWDAAGNRVEVNGTINVDARAPSIAPASDTAWHPREENVWVTAQIADAGSGLDAASVRLRAGGHGYAGVGAGARFSFAVPLAEIAAAGTEGEVSFEIDARDLRGNARTAAGTLLVDDRAPSVSFTWVQSPLSRDGVGNVTAQLTDAGAGVDPASARLSAPGMAPVPALPTANAGEFRVAWDASRPTFRAFEGPVTLTLEAADRLGHRAARNADVTITRRLFVFEKPAAGAITSSPAVAAGLVYFGSEDFRAYAVDRRSGAKRWEFPTGGRVTASPAVGADRIYVASEDGRLYAVKPDGTEAWRCPGSSTLGMLSSSPAIGTTDGEETVFLTSGTSRASYAMRGSGFVVDAAIPEAKACLRSIARGGGGRSSVALDGTGGAFVGEATATGGKLVKLTFAKAADGVWSFTDDWSFSAADQVHSSPALRAGGSVLFGSDDRRMYEVSGGTQLWSAAALGRVSGSPSLGASASYFIDEAGRAFALRLSDGAPAWDAAGIPVAEAPVRTAPAVGEDGTVYITAGSKLQARAPDGTLLWEYDAGGSVDGSSPALACDGAVYFGAGGKLHALITDSRGLAGSAWPKFRHDNHNTGNAATPVRAGPTCTD